MALDRSLVFFNYICVFRWASKEGDAAIVFEQYSTIKDGSFRYLTTRQRLLIVLKISRAPAGNLRASSALVQRPLQLNRRDFESRGFFEAFTLCSTLQSVNLCLPLREKKQQKLFPLRWEFFEPESEDWNSSYVKQKRVLIIVKRRDPVVRFTSPAVMFTSSVTLGQVFNFYMSGSWPVILGIILIKMASFRELLWGSEESMYTCTALKIQPAPLKVLNVKIYLFLLFIVPTDTGFALCFFFL